MSLHRYLEEAVLIVQASDSKRLTRGVEDGRRGGDGCQSYLGVRTDSSYLL